MRRRWRVDDPVSVAAAFSRHDGIPGRLCPCGADITHLASPAKVWCPDCAYLRQLWRNRQYKAQKPQANAALQARHRRRHPERERSRQTARNAINAGKLKRQPCQAPGCTRLGEAHHADYSKPFEVQWYCKDHHELIADTPPAGGKE